MIVEGLTKQHYPFYNVARDSPVTKSCRTKRGKIFIKALSGRVAEIETKDDLKNPRLQDTTSRPTTAEPGKRKGHAKPKSLLLLTPEKGATQRVSTMKIRKTLSVKPTGQRRIHLFIFPDAHHLLICYFVLLYRKNSTIPCVHQQSTRVFRDGPLASLSCGTSVWKAESVCVEYRVYWLFFRQMSQARQSERLTAVFTLFCVLFVWFMYVSWMKEVRRCVLCDYPRGWRCQTVFSIAVRKHAGSVRANVYCYMCIPLVLL